MTIVTLEKYLKDLRKSCNYSQEFEIGRAHV